MQRTTGRRRGGARGLVCMIHPLAHAAASTCWPHEPSFRFSPHGARWARIHPTRPRSRVESPRWAFHGQAQAARTRPLAVAEWRRHTWAYGAPWTWRIASSTASRIVGVPMYTRASWWACSAGRGRRTCHRADVRRAYPHVGTILVAWAG